MRIFINDFCGHPFPMQMSRELARRGHVVYHTYFADNKSTPKGMDSNGETHPNLTIVGLHIRRAFNKHGLFTRRAADIEYGMAVAVRIRRFRPDVVMSSNMPLDGQRILLDESKKIGARFVFWLQDIYSTAVRFVLRRKARALAGMIAGHYERVEKRLLRRSDAIVCIAPAFVDHLAKWKIECPNVALIPNWSSLKEIVPTSKHNAWSRENGLADTFCFMYSGTLGMKHRPELLLELAKHLEKRGDARLIVIAGGAGADWLAERAHEVSDDVLKMFAYQPYERVSETLGTADVLIALLDTEASGFAVPSKTPAYLCAGRPLIIAAPKTNEAARMVLEADAGIVISSDDPKELTEAAAKLLDDPELRARFGRNAREYAEQAFRIDVVTDKFLAVFERDGESEKSGAGLQTTNALL